MKIAKNKSPYKCQISGCRKNKRLKDKVCRIFVHLPARQPLRIGFAILTKTKKYD